MAVYRGLSRHVTHFHHSRRASRRVHRTTEFGFTAVLDVGRKEVAGMRWRMHCESASAR